MLTLLKQQGFLTGAPIQNAYNLSTFASENPLTLHKNFKEINQLQQAENYSNVDGDLGLFFNLAVALFWYAWSKQQQFEFRHL